jgi:hypothetical protein
MRVHVDIPELLPELCDYLRGKGWEASELGADEAVILPPPGRGDFEAAAMLLADVDLWRAQRPWARVGVNPQQQ